MWLYMVSVFKGLICLYLANGILFMDLVHLKFNFFCGEGKCNKCLGTEKKSN